MSDMESGDPKNPLSVDGANTPEPFAEGDLSPLRINDLEAIEDENINLSMYFAVDLPEQTFKATWLQLTDYIQKQILNKLYPVDSILISINPANPATLGYPGVWQAVEDATSINAVSAGNANRGNITGTNNPTVPVPQHNHSGSQTSHTHTYQRTDQFSTAVTTPSLGTTSIPNSNWSGYLATGRSTPYTVGLRLHNASTSSGGSTPGITINNAGTAGATINVQGKVLNCIIWRRTS